MPVTSVAFVEFYRQWPGYFCDSFNASFAGALKAEGHRTKIFKCFQHDDAPSHLAALERALLDGGPWDVVVVDRVWSHHLLQAIKRSTGAKHFVVMQWESPTQWEELRWRISPISRTSLVDFVNGLGNEESSDLLSIPNLHWRDETGQWHSPKSHVPLNVADLFAAPLDLAYETSEVFGLPKEEVNQTRYLVMNMGCPYRTAKNETGFLENLELPTLWGDAGCTFCNVGPYERQTGKERLALMDRQISALVPHGHFTKLVVQDEYIFRDLDSLVQCVMRHCEPGVDIMVRARVAYLESCHDVLIRALETFKGFGTITPYLVGFENFSDEELRRYNKGQTAHEGLEAAKKLQTLAVEYDNLRLSPSQGFILFGPWTTLDDLVLNLRALKELSFSQFRGSITQRKLRLNPDAALVAKARADNLLIEEYSDAHADNAAGTGYQAEIPYRFLHPEVSRIWDLLNGPEGVRGKDEFDRLEEAIRIVQSDASP